MLLRKYANNRTATRWSANSRLTRAGKISTRRITVSLHVLATPRQTWSETTTTTIWKNNSTKAQFNDTRSLFFITFFCNSIKTMSIDRVLQEMSTSVGRVLQEMPTSVKLAASPPLAIYDLVKNKSRQSRDKKDAVSLQQQNGGALGVAIVVYVVIVIIIFSTVYKTRGKYLEVGGNGRSGGRRFGAILMVLFAAPTYLFYALITSIFPYCAR